jgi:hypothetical protein
MLIHMQSVQLAGYTGKIYSTSPLPRSRASLNSHRHLECSRQFTLNPIALLSSLYSTLRESGEAACSWISCSSNYKRQISCHDLAEFTRVVGCVSWSIGLSDLFTLTLSNSAILTFPSWGSSRVCHANEAVSTTRAAADEYIRG